MDKLIKVTDSKKEAGPDIIRAMQTAKPGQNVIYYRGPTGLCSGHVINAAWAVSTGRGALCQRPTENYDLRGYRIWNYMIQKSLGNAQ
ncbi:hypothetical protein DB2_55 [Octadecabacter Antarctic DB virus 2]|nr:hypothetical protein DB2_55 [Octadecabacter Antarctic DB virus 2]